MDGELPPELKVALGNKLEIGQLDDCERRVPDHEIRFDISPRNVNLAR